MRIDSKLGLQLEDLPEVTVACRAAYKDGNAQLFSGLQQLAHWSFERAGVVSHVFEPGAGDALVAALDDFRVDPNNGVDGWQLEQAARMLASLEEQVELQ